LHNPIVFFNKNNCLALIKTINFLGSSVHFIDYTFYVIENVHSGKEVIYKANAAKVTTML